MFDGETSMVDGTEASGNFHVRVKNEQYESAVTEGTFSVLMKRISKINTALDSIIEYQNPKTPKPQNPIALEIVEISKSLEKLYR